MDLVDIVMPSDEEGYAEAVVMEWFKKEGDAVAEHEPLLEVSTDKVTIEVPAPASGVLHKIQVDTGHAISSEDILGQIAVGAVPTKQPSETATPPATEASATTTSAPAPTDQPDARTASRQDPSARLSPLVKRMLSKHDLDPSAISGTGKGGRITQQDVLDFLEQQDQPEPAPIPVESAEPAAPDSTPPEGPAETPAEASTPSDPVASNVSASVESVPPVAPPKSTPPKATPPKAAPQKPTLPKTTPPKPIQQATAPPAPSVDLDGRRVPHTPMRRRIAEHMVESMLRTAPHVTALFDVDLSAVVEHRKAHKDSFAARGVRLTYTPYFVAAAIDALHAVPEVNSRWHDDALEIFRTFNIGIATALERQGLIVPVIKDAQDLGLYGIATRLQELTDLARTNRLSRQDLQGGTFTITNHGASGSLLATPIINQPQSAILGIGKIEKRVRVREERGKDLIEVLPMAYVTLTIDHRALDGFHANQFLSNFVEVLESWS